MALFIILNFFDSFTTLIGLKLGLVEGNIIIGSFVSKNAYFGLGIKMLLAVAIAILLKKFKPNLFKPLNIAFAIIVIWNVILVAIKLF